jgi:hypothetical protein
MRFYGAAVLLLASSAVLADRSYLRGLAENRTEVVVNFEFQLEVFEQAITGSTSDVLVLIDDDILPNLQATLPNGGTSGPDEEPNVKFETIESEIFSACFTNSDECSLISSNVLVSYEGVKPDHSVELVTLDLVQDFLKQYSVKSSNILITYMYPSIVSTLTQFSIGPVSGPMGDTEVMVLETTFEEVFGAIVFAIEGDTEVMDAQFLYQDIFDIENRRLQTNESDIEDQFNETERTYTEIGYGLQADLLVKGKCRDCTSPQFGNVVNGVIEKNLVSYQNKLRLNGQAASSDYFDNITSVAFAAPELPDMLPPIEDDTIFDSEPPKTDTEQPWFLFFGISIGVCVVLIGAYCVCKETNEMEKDEDFSTSSSNCDDDDDDDDDEDEEEEEEEYAEEATYDDEDYQVETVDPTEATETGKADPQYEVYVF